MDRKNALVLLALSLMLAAAAYCLLSETPASYEPAIATHSDNQRPHIDVGPTVSPASEARISVSSTNPFDATSEDRLSLASEARIEAPVHDGLEVTVIDAETGMPVPKALISLITMDHYYAREKSRVNAMLPSGGIDELVRHGRYFLTDNTGIAWLPPCDFQFVATYARKGHKRGGIESSDIQSDKVTLRIRAEPHWDVVVLRPDGTPAAGVPVVVQGHQGVVTILRRRTNSEGRVRFEHLKSYWPLTGYVSPVEVALDLPLNSQVLEAINLEQPTPNAIELRLPEMQHCKVRVRTPEGDPPPRGTKLAITRTDLWSRTTRPPSQAVFATCDHDGNAEFEELPLIQDWTLVAWHPESPGKVILRSQDLEVTEIPKVIDVTWESPFDHYRARVIDSSGAPITIGQLKIFDADKAHARYEIMSAQLNSAAVIDLKMPKHLPAVSRIRIIGTSTKGLTEAILQLPAAEEGVNVIPDIRLLPVPILAAGTVGDADGKPISGAKVRVEWLSAEGDELNPMHPMHPVRTRVNATTDLAGQFALYRSIGPNTRVQVRCSHRSYVDVSKFGLPADMQNLDILMNATGTLRSTLSLPNGWHPIKHFALNLHQVDKNGWVDETAWEAQATKNAATWDLKWPGLPVGTYTLIATPLFSEAVTDPEGRGDAEGQIVVPGITIIRGDNRDPRIAFIDLTSIARKVTWEFDVLDANQEYLADVTVSATDGNSSFAADIKKRRFEWMAPSSAISAEVAIEPFFPITIPIKAGHRLIKLRRSAEFKIAFSNVPADTSELQVVIRPLDPQSQITDQTIRVRRHEAKSGWTSAPLSVPAGGYLLTTGLILTRSPDGPEHRRSVTLDLPITLPSTTDTPVTINCPLP